MLSAYARNCLDVSALSYISHALIGALRSSGTAFDKRPACGRNQPIPQHGGLRASQGLRAEFYRRCGTSRAHRPAGTCAVPRAHQHSSSSMWSARPADAAHPRRRPAASRRYCAPRLDARIRASGGLGAPKSYHGAWRPLPEPTTGWSLLGEDYRQGQDARISCSPKITKVAPCPTPY